MTRHYVIRLSGKYDSDRLWILKYVLKGMAGNKRVAGEQGVYVFTSSIPEDILRGDLKLATELLGMAGFTLERTK